MSLQTDQSGKHSSSQDNHEVVTVRKSYMVQLNKANVSDILAQFLDLYSSQIYDKGDCFAFDIVNFPFMDGDIPRETSFLYFFDLPECLVM